MRNYRQPTHNHQGTEYANSAEMLDEYDPSYYDPSYYYYDPYYPMDHNPWYVDSGATAHVASDIDKLDHPRSSFSYNHVVKT